jgi:hypothetical protein
VAAIRITSYDHQRVGFVTLPNGLCRGVTETRVIRSELATAPGIPAQRRSNHEQRPQVRTPVLVPDYSADLDGLIAVSQVIALEFATVAASDNYRRVRGPGEERKRR